MRRVLLGVAALVVLASGIILYINNTASAAPGAQQRTQPSGPAPQQKAGGLKGPAGQGVGRVVSAAPVTAGLVKLVFTYNGTVQPRMQVNLAPRSVGRLEQLLVDVGSEVKQSDPIAILERTSLQLAVQQAEANLKSAEARLVTVTAGGRAEDVASAQASLASAQARLQQVRNGPTAADLQLAQSNVEKARADLATAQAKLELSTQVDLVKAQADVDSYRSALKSAEAKLAQVKAGPTQAEIQAQQATVANAKAALITAQDTYETAKDNLSAVSSKATSVSHAAQQVQDKQAAYDAAVQKLNQMLAGPTASDLQSAQKDYDAALANYTSAVAKLEQMRKGPGVQDLQSAVEKAKADLANYESRLAQLKSGPTQEDLAISEAEVTRQEQNLAKARQPYTAQDIQSAQAAVDVAKVALATAKAQLDDATLTAPFSGVVTQRLLSPGAVVSSSTPVVTLVSSDLEITVNVEESRLSQLKPGLATTIATPAYPGQTFPGKVSSISPAADSRSHTFVLKVVPDNSSGKLRVGMYAEMKITAEERSGALLVPRDAVTQRAGKDVVFVIVDGKAQMREVVQGLPQDGNVEIVSGVKAGEQVIVVGHSGLNDGDPVRTTGGQGGQPSEQQQQQESGAPGKTRQ